MVSALFVGSALKALLLFWLLISVFVCVARFYFYRTRCVFSTVVVVVVVDVLFHCSLVICVVVIVAA